MSIAAVSIEAVSIAAVSIEAVSDNEEVSTEAGTSATPSATLLSASLAASLAESLAVFWGFEFSLTSRKDTAQLPHSGAATPVRCESVVTGHKRPGWIG